jgi:hypothetical protein
LTQGHGAVPPISPSWYNSLPNYFNSKNFPDQDLPADNQATNLLSTLASTINNQKFFLLFVSFGLRTPLLFMGGQTFGILIVTF